MRNAITTKLLLLAMSLLIFSVASVEAQNANRQYRQWQRARQEAQQRHRDYLRTRSMRDYRQWQTAQARAQRQRLQYQRATNERNGRTAIGRRYRVNRNGRIFYTDNQGAEALRSAINRGYEMGYQHGHLDREHSRRFRYNDDVVYRRATNGFRHRVTQANYQYYFREGYQRGYQDGYYNTFRYGHRNGSNYSILGNVIGSILNMAID